MSIVDMSLEATPLLPSCIGAGRREQIQRWCSEPLSGSLCTRSQADGVTTVPSTTHSPGCLGEVRLTTTGFLCGGENWKADSSLLVSPAAAPRPTPSQVQSSGLIFEYDTKSPGQVRRDGVVPQIGHFECSQDTVEAHLLGDAAPCSPVTGSKWLCDVMNANNETIGSSDYLRLGECGMEHPLRVMVRDRSISASDEWNGVDGAVSGERESMRQNEIFDRAVTTVPAVHGVCFCSWDDGSRYYGQICNDVFEGLGVYKFPDGSIFCGNWRGGQMHGLGTFVTHQGFSYRGTFVRNQQEGLGILRERNGRRYFGIWRDAFLHGEAYCISKDNEVKHGLWYEGEFQYWLNEFPDPMKTIKPEKWEFDPHVNPWDTSPVSDLTCLWFSGNIPKSSLHLGLEEIQVQQMDQRDPASRCTREMQFMLNSNPEGLTSHERAPTHPAADEYLMSTRESRSSQNRQKRSARAVDLAQSSRSVVESHDDVLLMTPGKNSGVVINQTTAGRRSSEKEPVIDKVRAPDSTVRTTKAQLQKWESEAKKLPRIPHVNYNRVLGRWYARVREPSSGRRNWKGFTCAVYGFLNARDMAINRLRQYKQLTVATETDTSPSIRNSVHLGEDTCDGASAGDTGLNIPRTRVPVSNGTLLNTDTIRTTSGTDGRSVDAIKDDRLSSNTRGNFSRQRVQVQSRRTLLRKQGTKRSSESTKVPDPLKRYKTRRIGCGGIGCGDDNSL